MSTKTKSKKSGVCLIFSHFFVLVQLSFAKPLVPNFAKQSKNSFVYKMIIMLVLRTIAFVNSTNVFTFAKLFYKEFSSKL